MKELREKATIKTPLGIIQGHLFLGQDGLPELRIDGEKWRSFRPAQFPDAWDMDVHLGQLELGPLLRAWLMIDTARGIVSEAQREEDKQ